MRTLLVVENRADWPADTPGIEVVEARTYLADPEFVNLRRARVFNLCRSYRYQNTGYYVSMLAEARRHKPVPTITSIQDLKSLTIVRSSLEDMDGLIQKSLAAEAGAEVSLFVAFGRSLDGRHVKVSNRIFSHFPAPFLQVSLSRQAGSRRWSVVGLSALGLGAIPEEQRPHVLSTAQDFFMQPPVAAVKRKAASFDLAILHDPDEKDTPSNPRALKNFARAAERLGMAAEFIERDDYGRLPQFDALFIRHTTHVNHFTYRFARRAAAEEIVVIDDPVSIFRCTNKVYMAELLGRNGIPIPDTLVIHQANTGRIAAELGFPCVLKLPDSSFSQGVIRVDGPADLDAAVKGLLEKSDLVVAQRYLPTEFDWRIGVLAGAPLYACKYFMARHHWQIIKRNDEGARVGDGQSATLPMADVPKAVVETALKASRLIGDGLYGVDLKVVDGRCMVIEINDNPNIDAGVEDAMLGPALYDTIMETFLRRIEKLRGLERKA